MKIQPVKTLSFCLPLVGSLFLTACGGGADQDVGSPMAINTTVSGKAVDGHLARATVYVDTNNDATRNAWEPFAFTDNEGYYSFNPNTNINYCAADASAEQAQHCLRLNTNISNAVIRIDSGYDVMTGEPFHGQLGRRVDIPDNSSEVDSGIISPLTTLLVNVRDDEQQQSVLDSLNLSQEDLNVDYADSNNINARLMNTALKVHKTVTILSDKLEDGYENIGNEFGVPNDASKYVYDQLANTIVETGLSLDLVIEDQTRLAHIVDNAENDIRSLYERKEFDMPQDMGTESNYGQFSRTIDISSRMNNVVNTLIDTNATDFNNDSASGAAKIIESLVIKSVEENGNDSSIDNALNFISNADNQNLVNALRDGMSSNRSSVSELARNDFSGSDFDSEEEVRNSASLPEDAEPFRQIGGLQLRVSDLDLGYAPDHLDDSEVELYFLGGANATSGEIVACAKHIDDANIDGTLGEGSTRGELLNGYWSLLGGSGETNESYSLLLTVTFLGTTYQSIIKPAGTETVNNTQYKLLRFDFDGGMNEWHSEVGLTEIDSLPASDDECETRLPSRIFQ